MIKNVCFRNLEKIEFVVTYACTGRCKHCSEGDHRDSGERIDPHLAADAVLRISREFDIKTVMTFGGEPLLYPDAVYAIMNAARETKVPRRQVITNGFFSRNREKIREVAERLSECGVNDLLLSVELVERSAKLSPRQLHLVTRSSLLTLGSAYADKRYHTCASALFKFSAAESSNTSR